MADFESLRVVPLSVFIDIRVGAEHNGLSARRRYFHGSIGQCPYVREALAWV
jgi:hypothetical protein